MSKLTFIGLGNMGGPMAKNLLDAGHEVTVFDLVPELVSSLVSQGAKSADNAQDSVKDAEVVISMLPAGKHVSSLYTGDEGLLKVLAKDALIIDCSTIDAETAREVHAACAEQGIDMLDAPVSGGVAAASAGTLTFMCGGDETAFARAKNVLSAMGKNIFHAGPDGAGQVAKMCNNMLLAIHMIGTSEALKLGEINGLDAKTLSDIMLASSGKNWSLERYNPYPGVMPETPASNDYQPGFMVDLMAKDLGLAMQNAESNNASTPLGKQAFDLYSAKQSAGDGKRDFSSIIEEL